jgi:clan AA aspartic protease
MGENNMGQVFEEITLKNAGDVTNAERGIIAESQIHQTNVQAVVYTGTMALVINEDLRQELGLTIEGEKELGLADSTPVMCKITEPVRIYWKDRFSVVHAVVLPGSNEVLLGVIPLEDMDLIVDPKSRKLIGAHGNKIIFRV